MVIRAAEPCRRRRRLAGRSFLPTHTLRGITGATRRLHISRLRRVALAPSRTNADSHCGRFPLWSCADARGSRGRNRLRTNDGCRRGSAARSLVATGRPRGAARDSCAWLCVPADAPRSRPPIPLAFALSHTPLLAHTHTAAHTVCVDVLVRRWIHIRMCAHLFARRSARIYGEM